VLTASGIIAAPHVFKKLTESANKAWYKRNWLYFLDCHFLRRRILSHSVEP